MTARTQEMPANLSDLLGAIRMRQTEWMVVEMGANDVLVVPAGGETLLYLVTGGEVILQSDEETLPIEVGSAAFVMRGHRHRLLGSAQAKAHRALDFPADEQFDVPPLIRADGNQRNTARVIVGRLQIDPGPGNPILAMVPDILPMTIETIRWVAFSPVMFAEIIGRPGAIAYLSRVSELFFVRALQALACHAVAEHQDVSGTLGSGRILRAFNSIKENPGAPWSVERLAREACMSRSSFAAEFTRIVGMPPMRMVAELRLEAAANLLAWGTIPVATVAWSVGYHSESSFSRVFKQRYGVSPGAYHREHRLPHDRPGYVPPGLDEPAPARA